MQVIENFVIEKVKPENLHKLFEDKENPKHLTTIYVT